MEDLINISDVLIQAALDHGIIAQEIGHIPEAEPVITGGSNHIFQALEHMSKGKDTYNPDIVRICCCYLFGKGVEAAILWRQTKDGRLSVLYSPAHLVDMDLHAGVSKRYLHIVQASCAHGEVLFQAHLDWCEQRQNASEEIDLWSETKELFLLCSMFGVAYALERKYHELPSDEKGTAYHRQEFGKLGKEVLAAAEAGLNSYQGKGVTKDLAQAFRHLTIAANGGHVASQYLLGMMFFRGEGTTRDYPMALHWFLKAAENGFPNAQHEASVMLFNGVGCTPDPQTAFYWCEKAASQHVPEAICNLGLLLWNGSGVRRDPQKALSYFKKAAALGVQSAKDILEQLGVT